MSATTSLPPGQIQFYDAFEPGLKDATYRIDLSQSVSAPSANVAPVFQIFVVQGPRFSIDPKEIHAQFPPNGSTSAFEDVLPHVVLNKRLLPWERNIPGLPENVPWLGLLVFSEGELLGDSVGGNLAQTVTVEQLLASDNNIRKPQLKADSVSQEELKLNCQAITFASSLFTQICPTAQELPYMSHSRKVNTGEKTDFGLKDDGWFSVVVANRFPSSGSAAVAAKSIVHLVSLEGFGDLLLGTSPVSPTQSQIQMVSLASWTFSCLADPAQTFAGLAQNLAFDSTGDLRPSSGQLLRLPIDPSSSQDPMVIAAQQRLQSGYVALGFHALTGEDGFAWYRSPFAPVVPKMLPAGTTFLTSDAARIYDPSTGVFDLSLAAAWQAGQTAALANQTFSITLMRLRVAINAALSRMTAPAAGDVDSNLAALFAGGVTEIVRNASKTGVQPVIPPAADTPNTSKSSTAVTIRTLLAQPDVQAKLIAQLQQDPDAETLAEALGEWWLLRGIPFLQMVPDARMLPVESIRFFYCDPNWLSALLDGALSIGVGTARESAVQAVLSTELKQMALLSALSWRASRSGQSAPGASTDTSGFLLRSALVVGWPGLNVSGSSQGTSVPILRLERLAPNVLLCLFNGVPDTIKIDEPQEGLEFGVNDLGQLEIRSLDPPPSIKEIGVIPVYDPKNPGATTPVIRTNGQRVLNISSNPSPPSTVPQNPVDLVETLAKALNVRTIGPAMFALQMVKGPERLQFLLNPTPKPNLP